MSRAKDQRRAKRAERRRWTTPLKWTFGASLRLAGIARHDTSRKGRGLTRPPAGGPARTRGGK